MVWSGSHGRVVMDEGKVTQQSGDYKMPTIRDIPELKTVLVKSTGGVGPSIQPIGEFRPTTAAGGHRQRRGDAVGVGCSIAGQTEKIYQALKQK